MCSMIDSCFMCSNDKCNVVDDRIVTQVEYLMPEITIVKLRLPLRICSICENNLQLFSTFKKDCVEYSLRLEARIKEAQGDNTAMAEKCATSGTNISNIHEVYIKEEVLDESDTPTVKDFVVKDISIKEDPLHQNPYDCEYGDVLRDIMKEESPTQTYTHLQEGSSVDIHDESDENSDPDDVVSVNSELNIDENILVSETEGRKIYTCLICKKAFKELSYLKIGHMKIHLGKKDFQCNECKKRFSQKSALTRHMKQHSGVKDFQCKECKKWFSQKSNLATHILKQHPAVKDFQCNDCKKWFAQQSLLDTHMKQHTGVKKFQCNECKRWFSDKSNLVRHMKLHTGIKDFQCDVCTKMFFDKGNLKKHMKIHTRIKCEK